MPPQLVSMPPQVPPIPQQIVTQQQQQQQQLLSKPFQSVAPTFSQFPPPIVAQSFPSQTAVIPPTHFAPHPSLSAWNDPPPLGVKLSPRDSVLPITLPAPPVPVPEVSRRAPPATKHVEPVPLPDIPPEVRPLLQVS